MLGRSAAVAGGLALGPFAGRIVRPTSARAASAPGALAAGLDWTAADYWALADRVMGRMDRRWREGEGAYSPVTSPVSTAANATMLTVHATAALLGHEGESRNDLRAVSLVNQLVASPAPWRGVKYAKNGDKMFHRPGWTQSLRDADAHQDKAIDPKVAEALALAYRAGDTLGLDQAVRERIVDQVDRCARGPFFRYPNVRLNQINWNCELYALAAQLTGDPELLRGDFRRHVENFCRYATRPEHRGGTPNLGAGWKFTYLPKAAPHDRLNLDSAEYANETIHFILFHRQARAAGMTPLSGHARRVLEAWVQRTLLGYWTHAGYLNWDTGFGLRRAHTGKTWMLAQQGLLAIALSPEFHHHESYGGWAKSFHDSGLALYDRWLDAAQDRADFLVDPSLFGLAERGQDASARSLFAARVAANAARAVWLGLDQKRAQTPPPLYSFDPDNGRVAITTPAYSTVILPRNHRAVGYGGLEPARLMDGRGDVASTLGGDSPSSFGLRVRSPAGSTLADSQSGETEKPGERPRIEIVHRKGRSRRRITQNAAHHPRHPYAGVFDALETNGTVRRSGVEVRTRHVFLPESIELAWTIVARTERARRWEAYFPSWGGDAEVFAHLRMAGEPQRLVRGDRIQLADVAWFVVRSKETGYVVRPRVRHDLEAWVTFPGPRDYSPHPGPTLVLGQRRSRRLRVVRFGVGIALLRPEEDAAMVAGGLAVGKA
ncbi:MAG TPA: hypothetical protein VGW11_05880 [Solirubrobacteraceae bacterium]|nr:hypothetical protein [Solirubrobacteraceae bacterium]